MSKLNPDVHCTVTSCVHHVKGQQCDATKISVGSEHSTSCGETLCATFENREHTNEGTT